jgi:hypothetical protein
VSVEIGILGEPEIDADILLEPAEMEVHYRFSIVLKSKVSKVILDSTHISSDNQ